MRSACVVFVGSLNRKAPYFQGARGVELGRLTDTGQAIEIGTPMCVRIMPDPTLLTG